MRHQEQIAQRIVADRAEPHEYTRMCDVMRLEIVDVGLFRDQRVPLIKGHHHDKGVGLGIAVHCGAADRLSIGAQCGHAPRRAFFYALQRASEPSDPVKPGKPSTLHGHKSAPSSQLSAFSFQLSALSFEL